MDEFNNENVLENFEDDAIGLDDEYGASSINDEDGDNEDMGLDLEDSEE